MDKTEVRGLLIAALLLLLAWVAWNWEGWFGVPCPRPYCEDGGCKESRQSVFWRHEQKEEHSCSLCRETREWVLQFPEQNYPEGGCVDFGVIIERKYCDGDEVLMEAKPSGQNVPPRIRHPQLLRKWREGEDFPAGSWVINQRCLNCQTGETETCYVQVNTQGSPYGNR